MKKSCAYDNNKIFEAMGLTEVSIEFLFFLLVEWTKWEVSATEFCTLKHNACYQFSLSVKNIPLVPCDYSLKTEVMTVLHSIA